MKIKKIKRKLRKVPVELSLMVLYETVREPRVHFLKLYRTYNGGLKDAPPGMPGRFGNGELGVEEVDPLSGACKLSKVLMRISEGKSSFPSGMGGPFPRVWSCNLPVNCSKPNSKNEKLTLTQLPPRLGTPGI